MPASSRSWGLGPPKLDLANDMWIPSISTQNRNIGACHKSQTCSVHYTPIEIQTPALRPVMGPLATGVLGNGQPFLCEPQPNFPSRTQPNQR